MKYTIFLLRSLLKSSIMISIASSFALSGFLSCVSLPANVRDEILPRVDARAPVDAFALVMTEHTILPDKCTGEASEETCLNIIKSLPPITQNGIGSGLLIKGKKGPIFLTAAHVCESETPDFYETSGIRITLKSKMKITLREGTGKRISVKVLKIDHKKDLCALMPATIYTQPVEWSEDSPKVGDKVYAISAPHGINGPEMSLIFEGFYSGKIGEIRHYTIPTRPGSSGSIVLDKNFKGVGMLNAAYISMESIGIGTGHKDIKEFIESI